MTYLKTPLSPLSDAVLILEKGFQSICLVVPNQMARFSGLTTPSAAVSVDRAVLQNTLEQLVLAQGAYFAMVAASHRTVVLIPALVLLFSVGRLLFWRGYERGAAHRACGFAMTFYPTIFACLVAVVAMV